MQASDMDFFIESADKPEIESPTARPETRGQRPEREQRLDQYGSRGARLHGQQPETVTRQWALANGYKVYTMCYPWVAYPKNEPRFYPSHWYPCFTDLEFRFYCGLTPTQRMNSTDLKVPLLLKEIEKSIHKW